MFYKFTDNSDNLRYIRFCDIMEVNVMLKSTLEIIMGNGKIHTKSFPTYEEASAAADSLIRMTASYKRGSNNRPNKPHDTFQPKKPFVKYKEY